MVDSKEFDNLITTLIVISSLLMSFDHPLDDPNSFD